jgi:hypothetical protein
MEDEIAGINCRQIVEYLPLLKPAIRKRGGDSIIIYKDYEQENRSLYNQSGLLSFIMKLTCYR